MGLHRAFRIVGAALLILGSFSTLLSFALFFPTLCQLAVPVVVAATVLGLWTPRLRRGRVSPSELRSTAADLFVLGVVLVAFRLAVAHQYLPTNYMTAVTFLAADLMVLPLSVIVFVAATACSIYQKRTCRVSPDHTIRGAHGWPPALLLLALPALAMGGVVASAYPSLSRTLEWARFGLPPPASLTHLDQISEKTRMWFPQTASLDQGEFGFGSPTYLVAKVSLQAEDLDAYLSGQPFDWAEIVEMPDDGSALGPAERTLFQRMGWEPNGRSQSLHALADMGASSLPQLCTVLVRLQPGGTATLYVYWEEL